MHARSNIILPSPLKCSLQRMPGFAFLSKCARAAFRSLSGRARVSVPLIANKSNA